MGHYIDTIRLMWNWKTYEEDGEKLYTGNTLIRVYDSKNVVVYETRISTKHVDERLTKLYAKYNIGGKPNDR